MALSCLKFIYAHPSPGMVLLGNLQQTKRFLPVFFFCFFFLIKIFELKDIAVFSFVQEKRFLHYVNSFEAVIHIC